MKRLFRKMRARARAIKNGWLRLSAFHRVSLGITISIFMVWGVRDQVLDRLQADLTKINTELADKGVPLTVPSEEEDNDVQEALQLIENLEGGLERVKEAEAQAVESRRPLDERNKNDAITLMASVISESGLRLLGVEEVEAMAHGALGTSEHRFALLGSFPAIYAFFQQVCEFRYPCRVHGVSLALAGEEDGVRLAGNAPLLALTFDLRLFYYDDYANQE